MEDIQTNTLAGLRRVFNKPDLDVQKFVANISKNGGSEILQTVSDLNRMTDEASTQMKKAIFNNFKLFIDASKAVTNLSTNLHHLDNQLVEQKRLCSALTEKSLFRDNGRTGEDSRRGSVIDSSISSLLSAVDGVSNLVKDPSRQLLFDADAVEVNPSNYTKQSYIHIFVLSDYVLIAKKQFDSFEMQRYRKQALYEIENVVTVDLNSSSAPNTTPLHLVQLLVFPDARVFQLESMKAKRALLATLDEAKRLHLTGVHATAAPSPKKEEGADSEVALTSGTVMEVPAEVTTLCFEALAGTIPEIADFIRQERPAAGNGTTRINLDYELSRHVGYDRYAFRKDTSGTGPSSSIAAGSEDAWLWEAPEDVDVAVAVRDFARAANLIARARRRIAQLIGDDKGATVPSSARLGINKLRDRIEVRASNLCTALQEELARAAERHGSNQSVRELVVHLAELGRGVLGLHLFLAQRSALLVAALVRGVRHECNQLVYLNRLSFVFHRGLLESVAQWNILLDQLRRRGLPDFDGIEEMVTSKLCSWVLDETVRFCNQLKVILTDSRSISFYAMACASERVHAHAQKATDLIGVDLKSTIDNCLLNAWQRAVEEQGRVYKDAVEHRASKSSGDGDSNIKILVEAGFPEAKQSLGVGRGALGGYTTQTVRSLSHFAQACARFKCAELEDCFATTLSRMLQGDLEVYSRALSEAKSQEESKSILANLHFFASKVIPKIVAKMGCDNHAAVQAVIKDFKSSLRGSQS